MVFESIVVDLLNRFVGSYVQNLDSSQLKLGIWGGDAVLQNLILKENALDELDLPVKTIAGSLGKLVLKIPWKNLYNAPVVASIENLQLLVVPNTGVKYNAEKEKKIEWDTKQQLIKKIEEAKRLEEERKKPKDPQQDSFTEKLVTQVIKNLQINIKDIHIRFEDKISNPGSPFAFGVTLHTLTFETTDENWKVGLVQDTTKMIYKLITMNSCVAYWNSKTKCFSDMSDKERSFAFMNGISTDTFSPPNIRTVLGPINSTLKLQLNPKPEQDGSEFSIPKILVIFVMNELAFAISKYQYQDILILSQAAEWMVISSRYRKYKPDVPCHGHAKEWWLFAYNCILEEEVRRVANNWSWKHIRNHRRRYHEYKDAYKQVLFGKRPSNDNLMQDLEKELDIFNISLVRMQADLEFERSGGKKEEPKSSGWFGGWFGKKKDKKEESSLVKQFEEAMTAEEKAKLCDAIGYQENMVPTVYPKQFVENTLRFELKRLKITIVDDSTTNQVEVIKILLNDVISGVEQRPAAKAIKVNATVGQLTVSGLNTKGKPTIVSTQSADKSKKFCLLDVLFETNPLDGSCDQKLHVSSRPLEIIYHADTINCMISIFKPPKDVEIYSKLQTAATSTLEGLKEYSATSFQHALDMHKYLDLNLDLRGPYIIIPENGIYDKKGAILLIDLGNLKMQSLKRDQSPKGASSLRRLSKQGVSQDEIMKEMIAQAYDKYLLSFSGIQILFAPPDNDWMVARSKPCSPLHIWQPTNMEIQIEKSVVLDDPRVPKMKIQGSLPSLHFNLSDVKVLRLAKLLLSIPKPPDESQDVDIEQLLEPSRKLPTELPTSSKPPVPKISVKEEAKPEPVVADIQSTNLEFTFEIGEVSLTVSKLKDEKDMEMMKFAVTKLGIALKLKTFETGVHLYLGGISLENKEFSMADGLPVYLIQTPRSTDKGLCTVQYLMADKNSPIYKTTYNSTAQLITVNFASLKVLLHQEAIISVLKFARNLTADLEKIPAPEKRATSSRRPSMDKSEKGFSLEKRDRRTSSTSDLLPSPRRRKHRVAEEDIDMKMVAKLETLSVSICSSLRKVLDINVSGIEVKLTLQKSKTYVHNVLRSINILDPTPNAVHPQILSGVGKEVIDTEITLYNFATKGENYTNMLKCDTNVVANIGRVRIFFLNKVIIDLVNFASNFQVAVEKLKKATVKVAEAAMENVQSAYEKASRISLHVNLTAPEIVMPRNSSSLEIVLLDMGQLKIVNKFIIGKSTLHASTNPPILESLTIQLQKLKMSRAIWEPKPAKLKAECILLKPITIGLNIMRNLSANWCHDIPEIDIKGKLGSVIVTMSQEDYNNLMSILNENLSEQPATDLRDTEAPTASTITDVTIGSHLTEETKVQRKLSIVKEDQISPQESPYSRFKFNFALDKLSIVLYLGSSNLTSGLAARKASRALAKFELYVIALVGEMLSDNSLWANVVLVNCILDDIREKQAGCVTRLMERTSADSRDMIDVTFRRDSTNDIFLDIKVFSFNLVACPDYLMMISSFFTTGIEPSPKSREISKASSASQITTTTKASEPAPLHNTTVVIHVEKPDIILLDDVTNPNTDAIILNNEISFRMKLTPERQTMSGTISGLQIISCCFNPELREDTKSEILSPCEINLSSHMPTGEGMHLDLDVSDIELHLTPMAVRLLTSISSKLGKKEVVVEEEEGQDIDLLDLWAVKKLQDLNFWYLKPEVAEEALEEVLPAVAAEPRNEQMIIKAKTILLTLEIGVGNQTMPMLMLEASFFSSIQNWTSALEINGGFTLEMLCYNDKLALWEPFIERVETPKGIRPWELIIELRTASEASAAAALTDQDSDEMAFELPKSTLVVRSIDIMDLCITKTSLDVLTNLGQAFGDAVNLVTTTKAETPSAPYLIQNFTGFPVTLILKHEDFLADGWDWLLLLNHSQHSPEILDKNTEGISEVVLEPNATVPLSVKLESVARGKKSVLKMQEMASDRKLIVKINEMSTVRHISVKKADKRFFPLPYKTYPGDQWGLVSDVRAIYGCKIVSLRSAVQVKNELTVPIEVYHVATEKAELVCCGIAEPMTTLNIPLAAVYTNTNELFFRPKNDQYKFSTTPYVWKDLVKNPVHHKVVECLSRNSDEKSFFIHIIGEIDQIYFEDTKKKTLASTCYILNLKPSVLLKNFLPIPLYCSLQGDSDESMVIAGEKIELFWVDVNVTVITLQVKDYLNQVWTCSRKLDTRAEELTVWTFESTSSETLKLTLDLGMYTEYDCGSITMSLYCPFWMINKTGLALSYKVDESSVTNHPIDNNAPVLFSFRAKHFFARKKTCLKIEDTEWSEKFSIDVVGSSGTVKCHNKEGFHYEVGVEIRLSSFKLTKVVVFTPYYLLLNNCKVDIEYAESNSTAWMTIPTGECVPFWPKQLKQNDMKVKIKECPEMSNNFMYNDPHSTLLKMSNKFGGIHVECQVNEASVILSFVGYKEGMASVRVVNCLENSPITYHQGGEKTNYNVGAKETVLYAWDNPTGKRELVWSSEKKEYKNDLVKDGIGEFRTETGETAYWVSFLDDMQRTLLFTNDISIATRSQYASEFERIDQEINLMLQGFGVSLVDNINRREVLYISISSSGIVWEASKEKSRRFKPLNIQTSQILEEAYQKYITGIKLGESPSPKQHLENKIEVDFLAGRLFKPNKRKIRRSFQTGFWIMYKTSPHRVQLHAKINRLQIDNQMPDCVFPVVLAPIPPPKTVAADSAPKPFTEVSIMMRKSEHSTIQQYQYFKVLIQEFHIKIDQAFINGLLTLFTMEDTKQDEKLLFDGDIKLLEIDLKDIVLKLVDQDKENFYDLLHFSPLKVHVSFSMQGCSSENNKKATQLHTNFLNLFVQSVGVTLTEIQDVIFKLAYFERQHKFRSQKQLTGDVITHYCGQAIKQMYVLVLGLDVIGNPFGLVIGLTQGVEDLFYEPIQGAIQGPEEFAEGLALGVKSLFGHAVGGAAGAVSRITGTLGKGVAALTLDEDYQRKRREAQLQRSANFPEGLAQSGKGLVLGVFDGVTGVFVKPIEGAKEEGVEGFFKGVGKGVVGLVTRPTAGVIDFASGTFDSVKRIAESSTEAQRCRPPRFFQADNIVRSYNKHEAEGNKLLQDVEKGKFASTDIYMAHVFISLDGKLVFLITDKRVVMVTRGDIFGQWNCDWQLTWDDMKGPPLVTDKGVVISLKEPKKKVLGLFGSGDNSKLVSVKNREISMWIAQKIQEGMEKQN